jgi:hypothetical protein
MHALIIIKTIISFLFFLFFRQTLGVPYLAVPGFEADDVIATLVRRLDSVVAASWGDDTIAECLSQLSKLSPEVQQHDSP